MTAALKTAVTLAVLALLMVVGVLWGFAQATKPFPKKADAATCVDTPYAAGDTLSPGQVTVNVLNSSTRTGLAGRSMQSLTEQGFDQGVTQNAPAGTSVASAEIWTTDRHDPAVRLLKSYVGKVKVRERGDLPYVGVDLVIGDKFGDLVSGKKSLTLKHAGTVCSPPLS